jgi:glycosyltransferase involved in cell wall biosynthesis
MKQALTFPLRLVELQPLEEHPSVSALVANHNYVHYVGEAPESVLDQTYRHFEVMVCDDGSSDEPFAVI